MGNQPSTTDHEAAHAPPPAQLDLLLPGLPRAAATTQQQQQPPSCHQAATSTASSLSTSPPGSTCSSLDDVPALCDDDGARALDR